MDSSSFSRSSVGVSRDHLDLADSVQAFARRHLTAEVLRAGVEAVDSHRGEVQPACWAELADLGLLGLHVPERFGGAGAGLVEAAVALEVLGRYLTPSAYTPTVLAAAVLAADGGAAAEELLPKIVGGSVTAAVAVERPLTGVAHESGAIVVSGETTVYGASDAELLVLPVDVSGTPRWVVVDSAALSATMSPGIDMTRAALTFVANEVVVPSGRVLGDVDCQQVMALATVVFGAEAVGVGAWCVETAAEYSKIRVQFGRPIGQFQGVKHRCAQAAVVVEQARAAIWDAARAVDAGDDTSAFAVSIARLVAPDAAVSAARDAMQVLGGIGYTWEHDAHLYYRRSTALRGVLGRSRDAAVSVAQLAMEGNTREVTPELPAEAEEYRQQVRTELAQIAALDERARLVALGDGGWVMPFLEAPLGRGAGPVEQVVIAQEMEHAQIIGPQLGLASWLMPSVAVHGTEEQKQELVMPTLRSEILWCQLFSEPEAGSDLASLRTEAKKVEGGWTVNGQKIWTSLGFLAEWGVLLARTNPSAPKHQGITYFLVNMRSKGVKAKALREASGGTLFSEVFFDDVFIPDSGVVGEVDGGWEVARGTLGNERIALGKGLPTDATVADLLKLVSSSGDHDGAMEEAGRLVADSQTIILLSGRTMLKQLMGMDVGAAASVAKFLSMRVGQQIADFCHAELAARGVYDGADATARFWMEKTMSSRPMTVYGGTTEVQLNVIAERTLGLPRDPEPARA